MRYIALLAALGLMACEAAPEVEVVEAPVESEVLDVEAIQTEVEAGAAMPDLSNLSPETLQRLQRVATLFEPDMIVENFSNMDEVMLTRDMSVGDMPDFPVDLAPLPETVSFAGREVAVEDFLEETDATSFLVLHDGVVKFEEAYQGTSPDDQRISWSVAKSFLSALVGRAIAEGDIPSVDVAVTDYVPELKGTAYDGATLRNVLNMASGVEFDEDYFDPNSDINMMGQEIAMGGSLDGFVGRMTERAFEPGDFNQYVSMDTHVIGQVLRAATGRTIYDLFEEAYAPVGLGPVNYITDGEGEAFVLGGLNMTTRGYAAFGELFRNKGAWEGEQIIPADWVAESTTISAPAPYGNADGARTYGYQWWSLPDQAEHGDYFANGIYGQTIYVNPELETVIVKTSADQEFQSATVPTIRAMRQIAEHYAQTD